MREIYALFFFGWTSVFIFQMLGAKIKYQKGIIFISSLLFLKYLFYDLKSFFIILVWVSFIFVLGKGVYKRKIPFLFTLSSYSFIIIIVFILFKIGVLSSHSKNILTNGMLPLGFSYIMFFSLAYIMDSRSRDDVANISFFDFISSILFFPTLLAGPFQNIRNFVKNKDSEVSKLEIFRGFFFICLGILKYSVSGLLVRPLFLGEIPIEASNSNVYYHPLTIFLLGTVYLYSNFSGFSDVAVGFSNMLGIPIRENFRFPFFSESFRDYWRNWHISLGQWFRDYIFYRSIYFFSHRCPNIDIGVVTYISTFSVFFLIGLWHGVNLKMVVYGLVNALLVTFYRPPFNKQFNIGVTFLGTLFINGLFLSRDLSQFILLMSQMDNSMNFASLMVSFFSFSIFILFYFLEKRFGQLDKNISRRGLVMNIILSWFCLLAGLAIGFGKTESIYVGF